MIDVAGRAGALWRELRTRPATTLDRNIRNLYVETFWAGFCNATGAFNAVYAIRLGASNEAVALLTSVPALIAVLLTIPAGRLYAGRARHLPLVVRLLFLNRVFTVMTVLVPWLLHVNQGTALVCLLVLASAPAQVFSVGWSSLLGDLIPPVRRARVVAVRSILVSLSTMAGIFIAGLWLGVVPFPANYQWLYAASFVIALYSLSLIMRLEPPERTPALPSTAPPLDLRLLRLRLGDVLRRRRDFVRMVANTTALSLGLWLVSPLYALYFVRQLGASDSWIGLSATLATMTSVLGYYLWQQAIDRWGEKRVLKWTAGMMGLYPLLVGLSSQLAPILLWTALQGMVTAGLSLSQFGMLMSVCPEGRRPEFLAIYMTITNLGAFAIPLLGVALAGPLGLAPVITLGGLLSLVGALSFRIWALQAPDTLDARRALSLPTPDLHHR